MKTCNTVQYAAIRKNPEFPKENGVFDTARWCNTLLRLEGQQTVEFGSVSRGPLVDVHARIARVNNLHLLVDLGLRPRILVGLFQERAAAQDHDEQRGKGEEHPLNWT